MKVTLISPYAKLTALGLRYISSCLKEAGHDTKIIFLCEPNLDNDYIYGYGEDILDEMMELVLDSEMVGISLMSNYFDRAVQVTRRIKAESNIPVVWGGIHPTVKPEECLGFADAVCIGEGEESMVELANRMHQGIDYYDTAGIWFKRDDGIKRNSFNHLVQDLDSIPFPDYDLDNHYILHQGAIRRVDADIMEQHLRQYPTLSSRGCPYRCSYCCNNALAKLFPHEKRLRMRSNGNVIQELEFAKRRLPFVKIIHIDDDAFFAKSTSEIENFSLLYKERIGLPLWVTGLSPTTVNEAKLSALVDAGLYYVRMGIQTASPNTRKLFRRVETDEQILKSARTIAQFTDKLRKPRYEIILDNPWETEEDLIATLNLVKELPRPYSLARFSLTFYPGTELYEKAKNEGVIHDELNDVYRKCYRGVKRNYLNDLLRIISRRRIPRILLALLTSRFLIKSRLYWLFYFPYYLFSTARRRIKLFLLNLRRGKSLERLKYHGEAGHLRENSL